MSNMSSAMERDALATRVRQLEFELAAEKAKMAVIQEVSAALGSTPNLDQLLDLIIHRIASLMEAEAATLFILDRSSGQLWSKVTAGNETIEVRLKLGQGIAGYVAQTGRGLNLKDAQKDPRFDPARDAAVGARTGSLLCQPLRNAQRQIIGVVEVVNKRAGYFTVDDENMLAVLGAQAVVSIENTKLYLSAMGKNIELLDAQERLRRKMEELDVLYRLEQLLSSAAPIATMFEQMLAQTVAAIPSTAGLILLADRRCDQVTLHVSGEQNTRHIRHEARSGLASQVARTGEAVLDNEVVQKPNESDFCPIVAAQLGIACRSVLVVPLMVDESPIGSIELVNKAGRERHFSEDDRKLLELIASQVAKAVQIDSARERDVKADRLATIGQLLSGVLHDFKTPMSIISGYVELMTQETDPTERETFSSSILRQVERIDLMIREILAFARGESRLLLRQVQLNQFLSDIATDLRLEFSGRGVELVLQADYQGRVRMDEVKMQRLILNLARNAREAMPDGGVFTIRTWLEGPWLALSFRDTGKGIPEEIQDKMFESFVTKGKKDGTGLGLAMVRRIVDEHQGRIEFSTKAGAGTTFTVRIPLEPKEAAVKAVPNPGAQERAA